ncbi:MAG: sulfite exporter TauE/SafE family protein [Candidatus Omnitrophota bacterium]
MLKAALSLFITGLIFGSGPCLASCGPILISYIAATKKNMLEGVAAYLLFSLARVSVYIGLALGVFFLGEFVFRGWLEGLSKYVLILGGGFIVIVGVSLIYGRKFVKERKSPIAMGAIIGLLPCAPLLAVFSCIGLASKSWMQSFTYSFCFGVGTILSPLIALSAFAGLVPKFLTEKREKYLKIFNFICAAIIILLGARLIRDGFLR